MLIVVRLCVHYKFHTCWFFIPLRRVLWSRHVLTVTLQKDLSVIYICDSFLDIDINIKFIQ